jgi:hypothetical protein
MKKIILFILCLSLVSQFTFAQDEEKKKDRPIRPPFESGIFIDNQTTVVPAKGTFESHMQHRFGLIDQNGLSDLFGIYAPSANTRLGFNYSITDDIMIGYGITRLNMYSDFQIKWNFLKQTRKNTIPISIAAYGNMAIDGRNKSVFTPDYKFGDRLSYFAQVIVGRKFSEVFSIELNASFTHYNSVPALTANIEGYEHDVLGIGGHFRIKFSPQSSIMLMYNTPLSIKSMQENTTVLNKWTSDFGIGYEVATSTHAFQIFLATSNGIIPQHIYMYNTDELSEMQFRFGFNITRLWNF